MKIKTLDAINLRHALMSISVANKFPFASMLKISNLIDEIERAEILYNKEREVIIDKFCKHDENGERVISEDKKGYLLNESTSPKEVEDSLNELNNSEIDISDFSIQESILSSMNLTLDEYNAIKEYIVKES